MLRNAASGERVYLDYAATTPIDKAVLQTMLPYFGSEFGNPSSMHKSGRRAASAVAAAREKVARILGVLPEEIIFTGSGTESDNLVIAGVMRKNRNRGNHLIVSSIEHKAVLESAKALLREGFEVTFLPVDSAGLVDARECLRYVRKETVLISIMFANNEIGTIEPIAEIAKALRARQGKDAFPLLHTDACQAAGFLSICPRSLGVDLMTLNSSKVYGPKGVGLLYKRKDLCLDPIIHGGEQEMLLRAGTESVPLIVGFAEALSIADKMKEEESRRLSKLRDYLLSGLRRRIPKARLNGHPKLRLPNNLHLSIPNVEGESMVLLLDEKGIEVSTGSACSSKDLRPSHVLLATGQDAALAHGSVRFSLGRYTTKKEIEFVLKVFPGIVKYLASVSALTIRK